MPAIGDKVEYVPSEDHAFDRGADKKLAWQFGRKTKDGKVEEITDSEADKLAAHIARRPGNRAMLVAMGPRGSWPAVVTALNDDDAACLDIQHLLSGVTLHYKDVPHDPAGKKPGTWH